MCVCVREFIVRYSVCVCVCVNASFYLNPPRMCLLKKCMLCVCVFVFVCWCLCISLSELFCVRDIQIAHKQLGMGWLRLVGSIKL